MLSREAEVKQIEEAKKDPSKFGPIYEAYFHLIAGYVINRIHDFENAKDLIQEIFIKAMLHINKYQHRDVPFKFWLLRIARNELYNHVKKKEWTRVVQYNWDFLEEEIELENTLTEKQTNMLIAVLNDLNDADLEIIELRYFEKRSFAEVGEILQITENNAKVKTYRIIGKIKKELKK